MITFKILPYEIIDEKDLSINALLAALNTEKEQGPTMEKFVSINPNKLTKNEIIEDDIYSYIDISAVLTEKGIVTKKKKIQGSELPARATLQVQTGDIILSSVRPERNAVARITEDLSGSLVNNAFIVLRPRKKGLSNLLFFILRSAGVRHKLMLIARGNAIPTIKSKDLKDVALPIVDLNEDHERIAKVLYDQWHKKQKNIQPLGSLVESVFSAFEIFHPENHKHGERILYRVLPYKDVNDRWDIASNLNASPPGEGAKVPMAALKLLVTSFRSGITISAKEYKDEGIAYLRIKNIENGVLNDEDLVFVSEEWAEKNGKAIIKPENVLISRVGTVGKTGVADELFARALASQHITIVETDQKQLVPAFLSYYMLTEWGLKQLEQRASGSAQLFIKLKDIKELQVPDISIATQKNIIDAIKKKVFEQSDEEVRKEIENFTNELIV